MSWIDGAALAREIGPFLAATFAKEHFESDSKDAATRWSESFFKVVESERRGEV